MGATLSVLAVAVLAGLLASTALAVNIETVPVGNRGNAGQLSGETIGGYGPDRICGSVSYAYGIGKYEVTAAEYCEFLNAVAVADTHSLYNTSMWGSEYGCGIQRSGSPGTYTYSMPADWANRPVNYVSYWDSCRFANWLHNGQPTGLQGPGTTETGAYTLNGYNGTEGGEIQRTPGATWAVTSEDEWYKAAYHKNDGVTGNYWVLPMGSNATPDNGNPNGDSGNTANFWDGDYTIGFPYWRTNVGLFSLSDSPYGTYDQGGNVWEWNESVREASNGAHRGSRGGSFEYDDFHAARLQASHRYSYPPTEERGAIGFRVAAVPEPVSIVMLALAGLGIIRRR